MNAHFWKKTALVLAIIVVAGLVKRPLERSVFLDLREAGFHPRFEGEDHDLVDLVGVQSFIGALGGLRYMLATALTLQASTMWEYQRWDELDEKYRLIHILQPRDADAWANHAWHMAYNAHAYYLHDDTRNPPEVSRRLARASLDRGQEILKEAIQWNPGSWQLYRDLANIYREKEEDPCQAATYYYLGSQTPNAPSFMFRFSAYLLAACPGKEEEAYPVLMDLYAEGKRVLQEQNILIWKPTLISSIRDLEEKLGIPEDQRIPETLHPETMAVQSPLLREDTTR